MDVACGRVLGRTTTEEIIQALKEDFDIMEYLERLSMPTLQKIVLGLVDGDLETQLQLSTADIDDMDYQGRTALSWAALRGDAEALHVLLRYGADPNVVALNGDAPLHYATRAPNPDCVVPLIAHGADVDARNAWQVTPIFYTASNRDDLRYILPLLKAKANPNLRDKHGRTALVRAIITNRQELVSCLLEHGVLAIQEDLWGLQPLVIAIEHKFHAISNVLIRYGKSIFTEAHISDALEAAAAADDTLTIEALKGISHFLQDDIHGNDDQPVPTDPIPVCTIITDGPQASLANEVCLSSRR